MNVRFLLAACLTLAIAAPAFAQDAAPASAASDEAAPAASDSSAAKPAAKHHAKKHHAHAAGDPAKIDHSADNMIASPPESKVTLPASPASGQ